MFTPPKAGGWAFGEILTSAQMNQLNTDFPFAIDGRGGGSYTPSSALVIGGAGLQLTSVFTAAANVFLTGASSFFTVASVATFSGTNFNVLSGCTAQFDGPITITGHVSFSGFGRFITDVITSGGFFGVGGTFSGAIAAPSATIGHIDATTVSLATATATGDLVAARLIGRYIPQIVSGTDSNSSYGPGVGAATQADSVNASAITTARTYTIDDTGATDGMTIVFTAGGALSTLTIQKPGATTIGTVSHNAGGNEWFIAIRRAGVWGEHMKQKNP